ncbi:hypothetical protein SDC9_43990 [bioreactor metagenome]|uniref:Long-chain-fatty-acyl-CoA reductase n=1 Tax=bioreactor metagenome TaxID=1076179 RepID=A0A644W251_9ZZZZ
MSTVLPLDDVSFAVGDAAGLKLCCTVPALPVFSEEVLAFFEDLSRALQALPEHRTFPDLAAFAFWCRGASVSAMFRSYKNDFLFGRGMAFHIPPGNVPLNFAYSLAAGLLAGNSNAVKLPSGRFPQAELLCRVLSELLTAVHPKLRPYVVCFRCGHNSPALIALSNNCAVRIIWGGDETIAKIRLLPLPPRAVELTFADRYSLCVIRSEAWLSASDKEMLAVRFFQDAYWSDQLACTAPRAVLWLGGRTQEARLDFWPRVSSIARSGYPMSDIMAVRKREAALMLAAECRDARLRSEGNFAVRVEVPSLMPHYLELCPGSGFFVECCAASLEALLPIANEKCQTITVCGVEKKEMEAFMTAHAPRGIDRVVPLGRSMEFALRWDGYDLIRSMSRSVEIIPEDEV